MWLIKGWTGGEKSAIKYARVRRKEKNKKRQSFAAGVAVVELGSSNWRKKIGSKLQEEEEEVGMEADSGIPEEQDHFQE